MSKKLVIDLDLCRNFDNYELQCSYNQHPGNQGILALRELALYELICRRCEERSCVLACPEDALEADDQGLLSRYNLRCIGCKSCQHACPFGTLLDDVINLMVSGCDMCPQLKSGQAPLCVTSCTNKAVTFEEIPDPLPENMFLLGNRFVVRSRHWKKSDEPVPQA
ncbi:MAG: hypothetical protein GWP14_05650 [Actinobacteria bacterium]|nr:hypothetical protein [Actinomycetota bacterium]